jgi:hypothetical protein
MQHACTLRSIARDQYDAGDVRRTISKVKSDEIVWQQALDVANGLEPRAWLQESREKEPKGPGLTPFDSLETGVIASEWIDRFPSNHEIPIATDDQSWILLNPGKPLHYLARFFAVW